MYNKVTIIGNLGADPELKTFDAGGSVCKLRVATSRKYRNKADELVEDTTWHYVDVFGRQAETCAQYLSKGKRVLVEGRLDNRKVGEGDDAKTYSSIKADHVLFLSAKGESQGDSEPSSTAKGDSDIPF